MENITTVNNLYYVAKVSKRDRNVRFVKPSPYNGLFNESETKDNMSFKDATHANTVVSYLNKIYELMQFDFYCYLVRIAENNTHVVTGVPEEYANIVNDYLNPAPTTASTVESTSTTTSQTLQ